jgi:hypothetical protein
LAGTDHVCALGMVSLAQEWSPSPSASRELYWQKARTSVLLPL